MTVYIEYVLIDNFVIDFILLKLTLQILGYRPKVARLFLCALFGAVLALVSPLLYFNVILLSTFKIMSGLLIFCFSTKFTSAKDFYRGVLFFFFLTFLLGGAIIGVYNIFNLDYNSEFSIATIIVPVYLLAKAVGSLIRYFYRRKNIESRVYFATIKVKEKAVRLKGFVDTGNMLYDGDNPVIIMGVKNAKKLLDGFTKIKYLEYGTVSGKAKMTIIENATVEIYSDKGERIINKVSVGVSKENIGSEYQVILHPDTLKEREYVGYNKKVS